VEAAEGVRADLLSRPGLLGGREVIKSSFNRYNEAIKVLVSTVSVGQFELGLVDLDHGVQDLQERVGRHQQERRGKSI